MPSSPDPPASRFNALATRDTLDLPNQRNSLISFSAIERTGRVPVNGFMGWLTGHDLKVDLNSDDAYTQALGQMIMQAERKLRADSGVGQLLAKPEWSKDDRVAWERSLAQTVMEEMRAVPGLDSYRTSSADFKPPSQSFDVVRDPLVNRVAQDMTSGTTPKYEFDCEQMSLTMGLAMHFVENRMLPQAPTPETLRGIHNYFYTVGYSHRLPQSDTVVTAATPNLQKPVGGHALIVSSATGNFIEATNNNPDRYNPGYKEITAEGHSFQAFLRSGIAVLDYNSVFADTANMTRAQEASQSDLLVSWCIRKVEQYGQELPEACKKPDVAMALANRPKLQ